MTAKLVSEQAIGVRWDSNRGHPGPRRVDTDWRVSAYGEVVLKAS